MKPQQEGASTRLLKTKAGEFNPDQTNGMDSKVCALASMVKPQQEGANRSTHKESQLSAIWLALVRVAEAALRGSVR